MYCFHIGANKPDTKNQNMKTTKLVSVTATKQTVKILGYTVTVGTKKHANLVAQVNHFNDLAKYETN